MNVNLNQDLQSLGDCLKTINNFGSTTYQNICTGDVSQVMWGGMDWLLAVLLMVLFVFVISLIGFLVVIMKNT